MEARRLTHGDLLAAIKQAEEAPLRVCGATEPHVVHPKELERGGWVRCANCFLPFHLDLHKNP